MTGFLLLPLRKPFSHMMGTLGIALPSSLPGSGVQIALIKNQFPIKHLTPQLPFGNGKGRTLDLNKGAGSLYAPWEVGWRRGPLSQLPILSLCAGCLIPPGTSQAPA